MSASMRAQVLQNSRQTSSRCCTCTIWQPRTRRAAVPSSQPQQQQQQQHRLHGYGSESAACGPTQPFLLQQQAGTDAAAAAFDGLAGLLCAEDSRVQLAATPLGRGITAPAATPAGTELLTLDAFSLLCVADEPLRTGGAFAAAALDDWQAVWGPLPQQLASYLLSSRGDWFRRLVAWLLWLARHGSGPWQVYTQQLLPKEGDMSSLMNFTPEERGELQCPQLVALAEKERAGIQGLHDSLFSSSTGELRALDLAPTLSDTLWACSMVNSRCFSDAAGREVLSLVVPLADMANHSAAPNAAYQLDPRRQRFSLVSTRDLAAGEEVLISYLGDRPTKSSAELMKDYGFVVPGNVNDAIAFAPPAGGQPAQLLSATDLVEAAAAVAAAAEATASADTDSQQAAAAAAQKRRTQAVMRSLQPFVRGSVTAAAAPSQPAEQALPAQLELVAALQQQCAAGLSSLPTSIADDEQLLAGPPMSVRHAAAVAARLEQKRVLAAAQSVLSAYTDRLLAAQT